MSDNQSFDKTVGAIAGAIYTDIASRFPLPPLVLVPGLTFKVRKVLETVNNIFCLSTDQKRLLAEEIQVAIIPMLFTYEIEESIIKLISPSIEQAALRVLEKVN